jgi:hypothetical protein
LTFSLQFNRDVHGSQERMAAGDAFSVVAAAFTVVVHSD